MKTWIVLNLILDMGYVRYTAVSPAKYTYIMLKCVSKKHYALLLYPETTA